MKLLLAILLSIVGFLVFGQLFIWFLSLGSSHNLPEATQMAFLRNLTILAIALILLFFLRKKSKN